MTGVDPLGPQTSSFRVTFLTLPFPSRDGQATHPVLQSVCHSQWTIDPTGSTFEDPSTGSRLQAEMLQRSGYARHTGTLTAEPSPAPARVCACQFERHPVPVALVDTTSSGGSVFAPSACFFHGAARPLRVPPPGQMPAHRGHRPRTRGPPARQASPFRCRMQIDGALGRSRRGAAGV